MQGLQKLSADSAITLWAQLAHSYSDSPTIAHNPHLFSFYSYYLSFSPYYFILFQQETPIGLFPVVDTGKIILSMPHLSYGGIFWLTKSMETIGLEENIVGILCDKIRNENLTQGFYSVEISNLTKNIYPANQAIEIRNEKSLFGNSISAKTRHFIQLEKSEEIQLEKFSSNLRRKISKAEKNEIRVKHGKESMLDDFIKVYQKNMHQLGSPAFGQEFFKALLDIPGANAEIYVAFYQGKAVGASFCLAYQHFYENVWFSTLKEHNHLYPSYALHWQMIKQAIGQNRKIYSLGRSSTGSGVHQYKTQWPVDEKPLYFSKTKPSDFNLKDQKWLSKIWKIFPEMITSNLGPYFAKRIY